MAQKSVSAIESTICVARSCRSPFTLVSVERDGTLGAVDPGQDRALGELVTPDACSVTGGRDLFVQIPDKKRRYRVVLELYRDTNLRDRFALAETPIFSG